MCMHAWQGIVRVSEQRPQGALKLRTQPALPAIYLRTSLSIDSDKGETLLPPVLQCILHFKWNKICRAADRREHGGSAPVGGTQQGVWGVHHRTMVSLRKLPAVCSTSASKRLARHANALKAPRCNPTHVRYAPLPPLAYLMYRAPLCQCQWSEMDMPLPMLVGTLVSVTQARLVPSTEHMAQSWEQALIVCRK